MERKFTKSFRIKIALSALSLLLPLGALAQTPLPKSEKNPSPPALESLDPPAMENCATQGGIFIKKRRGDGANYGICIFEDDRQCEANALLIGDCKKGGIRISGFSRQEDIYCAILGGEIGDRQPTCRFKDGTLCDTLPLFQGRCQKGEKRPEIMSAPLK